MMKISLSRSCFFYFRGINTPFQSHHPISQFRYLLFLDRSSTKKQPLVAFCHSNLVYVKLFIRFAASMIIWSYEEDINPLSCMFLPVVNTLHVFNIFLVPLGCHVMPESHFWEQGNKQTSLVICLHNSIRTGLKRTNLPNVFVHNAKCICPNWQIYLFKLTNLFVLLLTCMILSRRVCRGRQRRVHEVEQSRRTQPSGQFCCSQ